VLKIVKITLSLWDVAGQERFDLFKTDFFHGTAAVGLVFDLSRPDTLKELMSILTRFEIVQEIFRLFWLEIKTI